MAQAARPGDPGRAAMPAARRRVASFVGAATRVAAAGLRRDRGRGRRCHRRLASRLRGWTSRRPGRRDRARRRLRRLRRRAGSWRRRRARRGLGRRRGRLFDHDPGWRHPRERRGPLTCAGSAGCREAIRPASGRQFPRVSERDATRVGGPRAVHPIPADAGDDHLDARRSAPQSVDVPHRERYRRRRRSGPRRCSAARERRCRMRRAVATRGSDALRTHGREDGQRGERGRERERECMHPSMRHVRSSSLLSRAGRVDVRSRHERMTTDDGASLGPSAPSPSTFDAVPNGPIGPYTEPGRGNEGLTE